MRPPWSAAAWCSKRYIFSRTGTDLLKAKSAPECTRAASPQPANAGDTTQSSPAPGPALSECYNGEPHTCQWSNTKSPPQLNLALNKTKQHEKTSTFLAACITRKYTAQMTAATGLQEHRGKVSLGDFPCHGLGLSIQFVCMLAAQLNLQDSGFLGCKQE